MTKRGKVWSPGLVFCLADPLSFGCGLLWAHFVGDQSVDPPLSGACSGRSSWEWKFAGFLLQLFPPADE